MAVVVDECSLGTGSRQARPTRTLNLPGCFETAERVSLNTASVLLLKTQAQCRLPVTFEGTGTESCILHLAGLVHDGLVKGSASSFAAGDAKLESEWDLQWSTVSSGSARAAGFALPQHVRACAQQTGWNV